MFPYTTITEYPKEAEFIDNSEMLFTALIDFIGPLVSYFDLPDCTLLY